MNHFHAKYCLKQCPKNDLPNTSTECDGWVRCRLGSNNLCRLVQILMNGSRANSLRERGMSELAQAPL